MIQYTYKHNIQQFDLYWLLKDNFLNLKWDCNTQEKSKKFRQIQFITGLLKSYVWHFIAVDFESSMLLTWFKLKHVPLWYHFTVRWSHDMVTPDEVSENRTGFSQCAITVILHTDLQLQNIQPLSYFWTSGTEPRKI